MDSLATYEAERTKVRARRLLLLNRYRRKLLAAIEQKRPEAPKAKPKPGEPTWAELTAGIKMVVDQLRLEYRALSAGEEQQPATDEAPAAAPPNPLAAIRLLRPTGTD
jgi:hypothetical protein